MTLGWASLTPGHRFVSLVGVVVSLAVATAALGAPDPRTVAARVDAVGIVGSLVVVLVSTLLLAALVPRSVLAAAAGAVFGPVEGAVYIVCSAVLAASAAWALARVLGKDFVTSRPGVARLDDWLARRGAFGVFVLRLLPIAPFGLVSYVLGTLSIPFGAYLLGTAAGVAPSTIIYANLGASAMAPGTPAFAVSVGSAIALAVGGLVVSRIVSRRRSEVSDPRAAQAVDAVNDEEHH